MFDSTLCFMDIGCVDIWTRSYYNRYYRQWMFSTLRSVLVPIRQMGI